MLKKKSKILLVVLFISLLLSSVCFATSEISMEGDTAVVTSETSNDQVIDTTSSTANWVNTDIYLAEDKVTIDKVVDGNAFVVAEEVTVTGEIGGDLFVVANKLNIEGGYVYSSLFACANEITINGVVYDVYAISNNFKLESNGFIYRDLKVSGSNVNLSGKIRRDAYISTNSLTLDEQSGTIIYGNLEYSTPSEITIPEGIVTGTTKYSVLSADEEETSVASIVLNYISEILQALLLTFVLVAILLWLTPKFINRVGNMSVGKSFSCLGIGVVTPIVLVIVALLLAISVVGVKVLFPAAFIFVAFSFIASSIASIFFGKLFTNLLKTDSKVKFVLFTLLSNLVLWALTKIPFVGGFIGFLIYAFGIGTLLVNIVSKKEVIVETTEKIEKSDAKKSDAKKADVKKVEEKSEEKAKTEKAKNSKSTKTTAKSTKTAVKKPAKTTKTKKEDK